MSVVIVIHVCKQAHSEVGVAHTPRLIVLTQRRQISFEEEGTQETLQQPPLDLTATKSGQMEFGTSMGKEQQESSEAQIMKGKKIHF